MDAMARVPKQISGVSRSSALALIVFGVLCVAAPLAQRAAAPPSPTMTLETAKGTVEIRFFRNESPKTVDKIIGLIKRNFYRGQRIHRVERSLVQFGDPTSRNVSLKDWWGRQSSGSAVGVAEFNSHKHVRGAVAMAHGGDARYADSQIYIMKVASPSLDGKHVVIGQVTKGIEVVDKLVVTDVIKNVTVTEAAPK
jgi:cyclophilin family peptidyl-prolyl cis-trans isomerase